MQALEPKAMDRFLVMSHKNTVILTCSRKCILHFLTEQNIKPKGRNHETTTMTPTILPLRAIFGLEQKVSSSSLVCPITHCKMTDSDGMNQMQQPTYSTSWELLNPTSFNTNAIYFF